VSIYWVVGLVAIGCVNPCATLLPEPDRHFTTEAACAEYIEGAPDFSTGRGRFRPQCLRVDDATRPRLAHHRRPPPPPTEPVVETPFERLNGEMLGQQRQIVASGNGGQHQLPRPIPLMRAKPDSRSGVSVAAP
jgi:hypothetical protein